MESTFMTIHNLSPDANILFASESIVDILGYHPEELLGRSCFDYFHPDEVPFARHVHTRGVQLDKAAVLHYARIRGRDGRWIGCECVFTVTYDVLVACTSVYHANEKSKRRAIDAPAIRRLFASSPRDPRYHMLEHLSSKFRAEAVQREPRAAIILNRFTRTLTVMFATDAVTNVLGVTAEQFKDKSFYECIQENCLPDAIRCLESAKANDSIAYLRFWYRDPRRAEDLDEEMREASGSSDDEDGGVELHERIDDKNTFTEAAGSADQSMQSSSISHHQASGDDAVHTGASSQSPAQIGPCTTSGGSSTDPDSINAVFDRAQKSRSSISSTMSPDNRTQTRTTARAAPAPPMEPFELEAVVSCTSDGLVVILRRARPIIPTAPVPEPPPIPTYPHGLFAAPWGTNPIRPHLYQPDSNNPFHHGFEAPVIPVGGPLLDDFMTSIREVAVFAWSLAGINGNIASYSHGIPRGEAQPPAGLPIWDPFAQPAPNFLPPVNQAEEAWLRYDIRHNLSADRTRAPFQLPHQDLNLQRSSGYGNSSMGFGRQGYSTHTYLGNLTGYAYQGPGNYERNQFDIMFANMNAPQGWPPGPSNRPQDFGQGPSQGSRSNRYLWY